VLGDVCQGHSAWPADAGALATQIAEAVGKERPDLFVLVLPGPFMNDSQDMFGEGFDIFAEIQVQQELVASVLARSPKAGPMVAPTQPSTPRAEVAVPGVEVLLPTAPDGHTVEALKGLAEALKVDESKGSRASA
ncbi:slc38a6, partial [Symbiodinium pilosum]